jgi:hypothetical protein
MGQNNSSAYNSLEDDINSRLFFKKVNKKITELDKKGKTRLRVETTGMTSNACRIGADLIKANSSPTISYKTINDFQKGESILFKWKKGVKITKLVEQ